MTDVTANGAAAPPKKRSLFKKAEWQTAVKPDKERDMFSHSDAFLDIVAEQARQKKEAKEKAQAAKKRKVEDQGDRKKRKVSRDANESRSSTSRSGGSNGPKRTETKGRSRTPLSPVPTKPDPNSLSSRYDALAKFSLHNDYIPGKKSDVIDLGDSDSDSDNPFYEKPPRRQPPVVSIPRLPSKPAPSEDLEEVEDPDFAAIRAKARARAAREKEEAEAAAAAAAAPQSNATASTNPCVELFITSDIPDTIDMKIKVRTDTKIEKPFDAWCRRQGFSECTMNEVFLTWKGTQIYTTTTITRLGVSVDPNGFINVQDDPQIYDETNLPKIHLEAWTMDLFEERKKADQEEKAAKRRAGEPLPATQEENPTPEPEPEVQKIRLYLRARGKPEFKISVNPDTTFGHLTAAFKQKMAIPKDCPVTLMFDGERLRPLDTMMDAEIEDEDSIEVQFK